MPAKRTKTPNKPRSKDRRSDAPLHRNSAYLPRYAKEAEKLCLMGATDANLADFFGVSVTTINNWKIRHPIFLEALKDGKRPADDKVKRSLYERANGYTYESEKIVTLSAGAGEGSYVERVPIRVHVPPDVTACIFWLKNRRPEQWREKEAEKQEVDEETRRWFDNLQKTPRLPELNRRMAMIEAARAEAEEKERS